MASTLTERKMKQVMHEFKDGELESSSGDKVPAAPKEKKRH